jgi:hypothetical protein
MNISNKAFGERWREVLDANPGLELDINNLMDQEYSEGFDHAKDALGAQIRKILSDG